MMLQLSEMLLLAAAAIVAGGVANALADDLPAGRRLGRPRYADGRVRPMWAWLGLSAFVLDRFPSRLMKTTQPAAEGGSDQSRLGLRYPLTELVTAALALIFYSTTRHLIGGALSMWLSLAYAMLYTLIGVVDIERRRIPAVTLLPLAALALLDAAYITETGPNLGSAIAGGLSGFLIFYLAFAGGMLFAAAMKRLQKRTLGSSALGFGDVMLMSVAGMIVGFPGILAAICVTILAAAAGAVAIIVRHYAIEGTYSGFARMPYGPYILFGAIVVQLLRSQLTAPMLGV